MLMDPDMKVNGLKINSMDSVLKDGQMEHLMKANMLKAKSMERASSLGLMEEYSLEIGKTTRWKAMEHLLGQTAEDTLVNMLMT